MNGWESIFSQSPVNDGYYDEDKLPQHKWDWPKGTWFQYRLDYVREHRPAVQLKSSRKFGPSHDLPAM